MAVSSHRIHTIHGAFGAPSCFSPSSPLSINSAQASSFHRIPNVCAPRARPLRAAPAPVSRTTPASAAPNIMGGSATGSRPRRTSLSFSAPPTATRRAPPPPPAPAERTASAPAERTASALRTTTATPVVVEIPTIEDPFADAPEEPLALTARTQVSSYTVPAAPASRTSASLRMETISAPPGLARTTARSIPSARDIRGRLVASALLNRASGRPLGVYLRRRLSGQEHVYVKSGLSQFVALAA